MRREQAPALRGYRVSSNLVGSVGDDAPYEKRMVRGWRWDTGTVLGLINQGDA